jgi:RES domain-containing protein
MVEIGPDVTFPSVEAMGPFKPMSTEEIAQFNDALAVEIDSALTSSIRCCDRCFDAFEAQWPGTAFRDMKFQRGSLPVDLLVTQSRLPNFYDPAELSTLRHFVRCPRCDQFVRGMVWIHEHEAADQFEDDIGRVGQLGERTPFLVLGDPFAVRVLAEIRRLGSVATARPLPSDVFRARDVDQLGEQPPASLEIEVFGAPPAAYASEGRYNHAGLPMLYLSDEVATTVAEIGASGKRFYVARLELAGTYRILDLIVEDPEDPANELLSALAVSALVAAPRAGDGRFTKEYVFTRFVADCALSAGFDGIRYGSTRHDAGCNYVLFAPPERMSDVAVLKGVELITV